MTRGDHSLRTKILANVTVIAEGCWIWVGPWDSTTGYGRLTWAPDRSRWAHRLSYEEFFGPIPLDLDIDHLCRTPLCVNPTHLEPVSHRENIYRGASPFAARRLQTHCAQGHEFTPENTYVKTNGCRNCRECLRALARRRRRSRT